MPLIFLSDPIEVEVVVYLAAVGKQQQAASDLTGKVLFRAI